MTKTKKIISWILATFLALAVITHLQAAQAAMIGAPILFGILAGVILLPERERTVQSKTFSV